MPFVTRAPSELKFMDMEVCEAFAAPNSRHSIFEMWKGWKNRAELLLRRNDNST